MKTMPPILVPILRTATQGRILALLFDSPDRVWTLTELAAAARTSEPTALREVNRAVSAGIAQSSKVGQARQIRANPSGRFFEEVRRIILGTFGPPVVVSREFAAIPGVAAVVLFGSWVQRYLGEKGHIPNDLDVLVIGRPDRDLIHAAAERAETELHMPVQSTIRSLADWQGADPFLGELRQRPMLVVAVDDAAAGLDDLAARMESGR